MTITVPSGEESPYRPRVEHSGEMRGSIFAGVYRTAERCVEEIIAQPERKDGPEFRPEHSNIIAFSGGRGTGKTSAMLSVAHMLERGERMDGGQWQKTKFICLPMIDPSRLTGEETVLDVVLSRLYTNFDTYCRERHRSYQDTKLEDKQKVYAAFEAVYRAVRAVTQNRGERHHQTDSLEGLRYVASGNDLRALLQELVEVYMKVVYQKADDGRDETRYVLVLPVDDVDLNIGQGYGICEELRKYFNLPNVIILFSLCMEQMNDIVRQEYLGEFKGLLGAHESLGLTNSIPEMAAKYLEKLIPFGRRCIMPDLTGDQLGKDTLLKGEDGGEQPLVNAYLGLLEERTGVVLVKDRLGTHAFLPTTLRGLMHLWAILRQMPRAYKEDGSLDLAARRQNLETLQQYIRQYVFPELPQEMAEILQVFSETPDERLNQQAARAMYRVMKLDGGFDDDARTILKDIISGETMPENVSVGDVLFVLHHYQDSKYPLEWAGEWFVAVFRVMYSIREQMILAREDSKDDHAAQKRNLLGLLGGLLYTPSNQRIIRGGAWFGNCKISEIVACAAEQGVNPDALRDALLMDTLFIKKREPDDWRNFRTRGDEPYMDSVDRDVLAGKSGNTEYFTVGFLACLTNCMRSDFQLVSDPLKTDFTAWSARFLNPIPVISADIIDTLIHGLWKATLTPRKNGDTRNAALRRGISNFLKDLLNRSGMAECRKAEWKQAWETFPLLDNDYTELYLGHLGRLTDKEKKYIERLNALRSKLLAASKNLDSVQTTGKAASPYLRAESLNALKRKLLGASESLDGVQSAAQLGAIQRKFVPNRLLLEDERQTVASLRKRVEELRQDLPPDSEEKLEETVRTLKEEIQQEIAETEAQLELLTAPPQES